VLELEHTPIFIERKQGSGLRELRAK